ncbi:MAG: putative zinc-binding protein [Candidatus Eremiobacteraeota bacterium]|nr:putative zinc-binding protein [Candidatus Eremiobacteraeota bacterium]
MNMPRVVVIPCSGIGKPLGTVGRQATYDIVEKRCKETSTTTCLALLVSGDDEAVRLVRENPCIALDGCPKECARKNITLAGGLVKSKLRVMDILKEHRGYKPESVLHIGEGGEKLVEALADKVEKEIERILGEEGKDHGK